MQYKKVQKVLLYMSIIMVALAHDTAAGPPYNVSVTFRRLQDMSGSQFTGKHSLNSTVFSS